MGAGGALLEFIDFANLQRPSTPNTYLVAPENSNLATASDAFAPNFDQSAKELYSLVVRLVRAEKSFQQIDEDADTLALRFVAITSFLRFKDDVDVRVLPNNAQGHLKSPGSTLAIYSRSRVGYSDLGANAKRVSALLEKLDAATRTA